MSPQPLVSIITINYNGLSLTSALLRSLGRCSVPYEVIVVDNGSKNDEAAAIADLFPEVRVVRSEKNLGFAGGNNLGMREAKGKYLFFVNNDTEIPSLDHITTLIDRMRLTPSIGMVCPKLRFAWGQQAIQFAGYTPLSPITLRNSAIGCGEPDHSQYDSPHPTPYAHGAAMLVSREALQEVGEMPECYFLYYEELDWSMMFTRKGYAIWYDPALTVFHKESQTTGSGSPMKCYYMARNRLLFAKRNISMPTRLLTYAYLLLAVNPRDICSHLLHRRWTHAAAVVKGMRQFLFK